MHAVFLVFLVGLGLNLAGAGGFDAANPRGFLFENITHATPADYSKLNP